MKLKRTVALILSTLLVLTMIPVMALTTSAAEVPGNWQTYRGASNYDPPVEGEEDDDDTYTPAPGYHYTSEGFVTIPADYTNVTPFFSVASKEKVSIKDGVYMEVRVDDFSYKGELGNADEWISFSLWTKPYPSPGDTKRGEGWTSLIRGDGMGSAAFQSFCTTEDREGAPGSFAHTGDVGISPPLDENDKEHYIFTVEYDGSNYSIKMNGVEISQNQRVSDHLNAVDETGDFYIGVSFHSAVLNGTAAMSILKYGTSESDATIPTGNDQKDPDENVNVFGERIDPATIEKNQPVLFWNADRDASVGKLGGQNITKDEQGDNSIKITPSIDAGFFVTFPVKNKYSAFAEDFPIFAVLLHNCPSMDGGFYFNAGENAGASESNLDHWYLEGKAYDDNDEMVLMIFDGTDTAEGRIHSLRMDFSAGGIDLADAAFEIKWAGQFRTAEEAIHYSDVYLGLDPDATEAPTGAPTEAPTEAPTDAPVETPTKAPTEIVTPGEDQPADTATVTGNATEAVTEEEKKGGCASVVGIGSVTAILMAAAAAVALKKKE